MPIDANRHHLDGTGTPGGCGSEEVFVLSDQLNASPAP
jgi:hypothetical protein